MNRIIPIDKADCKTCEYLRSASDDEVIPHISGLLQCLQDLNWPIAFPVSERLSQLDDDLVDPILKVLSGTDEIWKYWIVSHLLHTVKYEVYQRLLFKLNQMRHNPTEPERNEEVYDVVCELLESRTRA